MTKFILHGGFTRKDNESNRLFFEEFLRDVPENGNVLLVYFAARNDDMSEISTEQIQKLKALSGDRKLNFTIAEKENFRDQAGRADAVYIHGGSTSKLLDVLHAYPDLKVLVQGKTVAGSSAGAYAITSLGPSHLEEVLREGLGLVPLRIICHYESSELPPNVSAVTLLKNTAQDLELVIMKDCEWRVFKY